MLPAFDERGNLPPGPHRAGWAESVQRFGYTDHRMALIAGMAGAIGSLGRAGCRAVSVDGSFVTANEHPEDYDGCRDDVGTSTDMLDSVLRNLGGNRRAQNPKYGGEFFPASYPARPDGLP